MTSPRWHAARVDDAEPGTSVPSRRSLLTGGGVALTVALLAACDSRTAAASSAGPSAAAGAAATLMVVRHAEKPTGDGAPYGVTGTGEPDAESLTVRGWTRAGALVELFAPATGAPPRAGLRRPDRVVAADPTHGSRRPAQTATPTAQRLGVDLVTTWAKGDEAPLAADLRRSGGATLVAWEHERIPDIVAGLGDVRPTPPSTWPGDRFDLVWVFDRSGGGWTFTQVPQRLLPGDVG